MNKIKIIYGEPQSGRTLLSKIITIGRNTCVLDGCIFTQIDSPFKFIEVDETTDVIVLEDTPSDRLYPMLWEFFNPKLCIEKPSIPSLLIDRPDIIIITDKNVLDSEFCESTARRIELLSPSFPFIITRFTPVN